MLLSECKDMEKISFCKQKGPNDNVNCIITALFNLSLHVEGLRKNILTFPFCHFLLLGGLIVSMLR